MEADKLPNDKKKPHIMLEAGYEVNVSDITTRCKGIRPHIRIFHPITYKH